MGATGAQVQYNMVRGHLSSMFISLIASYMESTNVVAGDNYILGIPSNKVTI